MPFVPRAPDARLRAWFDHERAARSFRALLSVAEPAGIPVLPVKGAVLARTIYADVSERPICDVDVRVREGDLRRLRRLCRAEGWPTEPGGNQWGAFHVEIASMLVDVESSIGPPGICAMSVDEMIARASTTTEGFGFAHLEPELHDHALLLCVNAFKDKIRYARPSALGDLARVAGRPGFDPGAMAALAERAGLRACVWIVADWAATDGGAESWREVRDLLGLAPPRPLYVRAYRALMRSPRRSRLVFPVLARAASDRPALRAEALAKGGLGALRWALVRALRAARRATGASR